MCVEKSEAASKIDRLQQTLEKHTSEDPVTIRWDNIELAVMRAFVSAERRAGVRRGG
ncbi:hypothetical protein [Rhizobium sp. LC145]|uniref:hypothetical protein n=1 Tax=Rhizobium sp. LC145 TaxID=1120688 RepID=UPI000B320969|nr:hypothetical protein [Rhizobium sp. LC145]